jgi:chromosome segregation ATPase
MNQETTALEKINTLLIEQKKLLQKDIDLLESRISNAKKELSSYNASLERIHNNCSRKAIVKEYLYDLIEDLEDDSCDN